MFVLAEKINGKPAIMNYNDGLRIVAVCRLLMRVNLKCNHN